MYTTSKTQGTTMFVNIQRLPLLPASDCIVTFTTAHNFSWPWTGYAIQL